MQTINRTLDNKIIEVERGHLSDRELDTLETYIQGFTNRSRTYNLLRDRSDAIIDEALALVTKAYPVLMQNHQDRCRYDMESVLRYIALSVLRDDELMFKTQIMAWLSSILACYPIKTEVLYAYSKMQEKINQYLPTECSKLIDPYIQITLRYLEQD